VALIPHNPRYSPHIPDYAASAAGFHTSEIFFTDDEGVYCLQTRDAPPPADMPEDGVPDLLDLLTAHQSRIRKIHDERLRIPAKIPYMGGHNTWVVNRPGSTLVVPVGDLAQHVLAALCYFTQNGQCFYDDIHRERIAGLDRFGHLVNLQNPIPLTFLEQISLAELTAELSTACYAGVLMLQAMGLGGWMFDGLDPYTVLGASGSPDAPGLGFRYTFDERWPFPNPTGLPGIFAGYTPPHYTDMRKAVDALVQRNFGAGGPFHPGTPGPYRETPRVRGSALVHDEEFRECVALQARYIYDRFGKFPATVPSIFVITCLQAHHLDREFYDRHFSPGAYLRTHAEHMEQWHPKRAD